jgi:hypothetical protein
LAKSLYTKKSHTAVPLKAGICSFLLAVFKSFSYSSFHFTFIFYTSAKLLFFLQCETFSLTNYARPADVILGLLIVLTPVLVMNQYCTKFNSNKLITYLNHKASTRQPILSLIFVNYVFVFEIVQQRISHPA